MTKALFQTHEIDQRNHKVRISFVLPFIDPSEFDPYFGDFQYLMTSAARSRLKGYLRTFVYMTICGLLLMFGGAAFFIRESIEIAEDVKDNNGIMTSQSNHSTIKSDSNYHSQNHDVMHRYDPDVSSRHKLYATELRIIGFIFLGIGFLLFVIGAPLSYQFWKRYQRSKKPERNPILEASAHPQLNPHKWRRIKSEEVCGTFQNPIQFEDNASQLNIGAEVQLLPGENLPGDPVITTRDTSRGSNFDSSHQVLFRAEGCGSKPAPSLLQKLFAIDDDELHDDVITLHELARTESKAISPS